MGSKPSISYLNEMNHLVTEVAETICSKIEEITGDSFLIDKWSRKDHLGMDGGGGITRIIKNGEMLESGAVNTSFIYGAIDPEFSKQLHGSTDEVSAVGISLIFHPRSPQVPTVHMNFRYIQHGEKDWFGGGADLTPYLPNEELFKSFHSFWKSKLDCYDLNWFPEMKKACDQYFYIPHRNEMRGVGGIFYDHQPVTEQRWNMVQDLARGFIDIYSSILTQCKGIAYTEEDRDFQLYRRGRYVEFNLVYDRGTLFGLKTNGRIESILSSLPMQVRFEYQYEVPSGSPYEKMSSYYQPREWV